MSTSSIILNNPILYGYLAWAGAFVLGAAIASLVLILARRRLFAPGLVSIETEENRRLQADLKRERSDNAALRSERSTDKGSMAACQVKLNSAVSIIQSASNSMEVGRE